MPTPPKPVALLRIEGKSHRTKAELEQREASEQALTTGEHMAKWPEVRRNICASREFDRVSALLRKISKDDALHESVVNRYCLLRAECAQFEDKRETFYRGIKQMERAYSKPEDGKVPLEPSEYFRLLQSMQANIINLDKQIMAKRKMMLDIEKENIMTIASVLRSIPKIPDKVAAPVGMAGFLAKRAEQ